MQNIMVKNKFLLIFATLAVLHAAIFADPVEGYWIATNQITGKHLCGWQLYIESGILYGKILSAEGATAETVAKKCTKKYPDFPVGGEISKMKMFGTPFIYGLTSTEPGKWAGGYIINPDDGTFYRCTITFHAADGKKYKTDTLEMYGMLKNVNIGVSQYWPSGTKEEAEGIK